MLRLLNGFCWILAFFASTSWIQVLIYESQRLPFALHGPYRYRSNRRLAHCLTTKAYESFLNRAAVWLLKWSLFPKQYLYFRKMLIKKWPKCQRKTIEVWDVSRLVLLKFWAEHRTKANESSGIIYAKALIRLIIANQTIWPELG